MLLDRNKTTAENVREVLINICRRHSGPNDGKKASRYSSPAVCLTNPLQVNYLEALTRLLQETERGGEAEHGMRVREILMCLRIPLTSTSESVRAATLKGVRYLVRNKKDVLAITKVSPSWFLCESLLIKKIM